MEADGRETQVAKAQANRPKSKAARKEDLPLTQGEVKWTEAQVLTNAQRAAIGGIARKVAEDVFSERIAAALADPDVKGSKSALGYLLGRVRRR